MGLVKARVQRRTVLRRATIADSRRSTARFARQFAIAGTGSAAYPGKVKTSSDTFSSRRRGIRRGDNRAEERDREASPEVVGLEM